MRSGDIVCKRAISTINGATRRRFESRLLKGGAIVNEIKTAFILDGDQPQEEALIDAVKIIRKRFYPDFDGQLIYTKRGSCDRTFFFTYSDKIPGLYATGFVDFAKRPPIAHAMRYRFKPGREASVSSSILPDVSDEDAWKVAIDYQIDMDWAGSAYASAEWEFRYDKSNHDILTQSHKSQGGFLLTDQADDDEESIEEAYDDGWAAYVCEDYEKAAYFFECAAKAGNSHAAYLLGGIYERDRYSDFEKAAFWFGKAAEQGHADAQYRLGICCDSARGTKVDMEKAAYLFEQAAVKGNEYAQYRLGGLYEFGRGVEKDAEKARYWFGRAAEPNKHGTRTDALNRIRRMDGDERAIEMWRWDWHLADRLESNSYDDIVYLPSDAFNCARETEKDGDWARTLDAYKEAYVRYGSIAALREIGRIYAEGLVDGRADTEDAVSAPAPLSSGETRVAFMEAHNDKLRGRVFGKSSYTAIYPLRLYADETQLRIYRICVYVIEPDGISDRSIAVIYRFTDDTAKIYKTMLMRGVENAEGEKTEDRFICFERIPLDQYFSVSVEGLSLTFTFRYLLSDDPLNLTVKCREVSETFRFTEGYGELLPGGSVSSTIDIPPYTAYEHSLPYEEYSGEVGKERAIALLHHAACGGNIEAMYYLGCYYNAVDEPGRTKENSLKARKWFEKAAGAGLIRSMRSLVRWYQGEETVYAYDRPDEKKLARESADVWRAKTQLLTENRKKYYPEDRLDGSNDPVPDPSERCYWLTKAAEAGLTDAMRSLAYAWRTGRMYIDGKRLAPDQKKAAFWYEEEALHGGVRGKYHVPWAMYGLWERYRDGVEGLEADMERAVYWLEKSAKAGYDDAQIQLGHMYYNGEWFPQDKVAAAYWYDKGSDRYVEYDFDSDQLDTDIWVKLYKMYSGADGIEPNPERAAHFRKRLKKMRMESLLDD